MSNTLPTLNLIEKIGMDKKLETIWSEYYKNDQNPISAVFQKEILKNAVTYLSLNPSLTPHARKTAKRGFYPEIPYPLIDWTSLKAEYKFFQKFYDLGKEINPWTVIDLLYIRESTQGELKIKFDSKSIIDHEKEFLISQIRLSFEILQELNPKVVVVANALTDKLIHKYFHDLDLKQEFPSEINGWVYKINGIPFITNESRFLGSRIHGLNIHRRESLVKEIRRILTAYHATNNE
jgi:hypothetical protein